jgi:hypothetical protein
VVILLPLARGITKSNFTALSPEGFFAMVATAQVKFQPQLAWVTLLVQNSPSDHRFGSTGLNLTFEGLLLGVSLQHHVKGTDSDPRESSMKHVEGVHDAFTHLEGTPLCFLQESRGISGPWMELMR